VSGRIVGISRELLKEIRYLDIRACLEYGKASSLRLVQPVLSNGIMAALSDAEPRNARSRHSSP
jgi:hypothetical protein